MVMINLLKHCVCFKCFYYRKLEVSLLILGEMTADSQMLASSSLARPVCPVYTQIHICLKCSIVLTMHANRNA